MSQMVPFLLDAYSEGQRRYSYIFYSTISSEMVILSYIYSLQLHWLFAHATDGKILTYNTINILINIYPWQNCRHIAYSIEREMVMVYINSSYFRCVTTDELEREANTIMTEARKRPAPKHSLLVADPGDSDRKWGLNKPINKKSLVSGTVPKLLKGNQTARDCTNLYYFLETNKKESFCYPRSMSRQDIFPSMVPLVDFMSVDSKRPDSYKYPSREEIKLFQANRGIDLHSLKPDGVTEVEVRELVMGESSEDQIWETLQWLDSKIVQGLEIYPARVISFDVEEITISETAKDQLVEGSPGTQVKALKTYPGSSYQWPAKFLLGDGLRYMLVITWPADDNQDHYLIPVPVPQKGIVKLLRSLPTTIGCGISNDIKHLTALFDQISPNYPLKMKAPLELSVVAVAAGWALRATNMAALSLGVLGGLLDKISSRADGMWCLKWDKLPVQFKIYALGDIKFGYMTFVVLSSVFIRDIYPDPDAHSVQEFASQSQGVRSVCDMMCLYLAGSEVHFPPQPCTTRLDLMNCIKVRVPNSSGRMILSEEPSPGAVRFSSLIRQWPTITDGGPRYLHQIRTAKGLQVRERMTNGVEEMKKYAKTMVCRDVKDSLLRSHNLDQTYLAFSQPELSPEDYKKPVLYGTLGLVAHPDLKKKVTRLMAPRLHASSISNLGKVSGCPGRSCLLEYARLFPVKIPAMLKSMEKSRPGDITKEFWLAHRSLYEDLRLMSYALSDSMPEPIEWIEEKISATMEASLKEHTSKMERAKQIYDQEKVKVEWMKQLKSSGSMAHRTDPAGQLSCIGPNFKFEDFSYPKVKTTNVPFPSMKRRSLHYPSKSPGSKKLCLSLDPRAETQSETDEDQVWDDEGDGHGDDLNVSLEEVSDTPIALDSSLEIIDDDLPGPSTGVSENLSTPPRVVRFSPADADSDDSKTPPRVVRLMPGGMESDSSDDVDLEYFDRDGSEWIEFD